MNQATVQKLNALNQEFYQKVAANFSQSRDQAWTGWTQLVPLVDKALRPLEAPVVYDVGCGNGRFALFLKNTFPEINIQYVGVDNSQELLNVAAENVSKVYQKESLQLIKVDILDKLIEYKSNFISLFGVLHHVPSYEKRVEVLKKAGECLLPEGLLVFTAWQFTEIPSLLLRQKTAADLGIEQSELEQNDYLLTWERGESAVRYCHLTTDEEAKQLIKEAGLELVTDFLADGKENRTNHYYMVKNTTA